VTSKSELMGQLPKAAVSSPKLDQLVRDVMKFNGGYGMTDFTITPEDLLALKEMWHDEWWRIVSP